MSQEYCWECEESYARDELFDIPVFNKGYTVKWCFNCAMKQLRWSDYCLIKRPLNHKDFKIKSIEDSEKEWSKIRDEITVCYELQVRKLKDFDNGWGEIHMIVNEILNDKWDLEEEES